MSPDGVKCELFVSLYWNYKEHQMQVLLYEKEDKYACVHVWSNYLSVYSRIFLLVFDVWMLMLFLFDCG